MLSVLNSQPGGVVALGLPVAHSRRSVSNWRGRSIHIQCGVIFPLHDPMLSILESLESIVIRLRHAPI